jgi:hypothetical protein
LILLKPRPQLLTSWELDDQAGVVRVGVTTPPEPSCDTMKAADEWLLPTTPSQEAAAEGESHPETWLAEQMSADIFF